MTNVAAGIARPRILFFALANDIGQERLPAAMTKLGATCAIVSPPGFYCTKTRFLEQRFILPAHYGFWRGMLFARGRLEAAVQSWHPDLLVPLDDVAALLVRNLATSASATPALRDLIETSLGAFSGYAAAGSRAKLMQVASALPIRIPRHHVADDAAATLQVAAAWGYPVVLKAEHTCGGQGVVIARNQAELSAALLAGPGPAALWRHYRNAGRRRLWRLAGVIETGSMSPVLQEMIQGVPAMRTVAAWQGEVLEGASFVAERVHPAPTGASTIVSCIEHPEMETAVRLLVRDLDCSGFVSFDFMLDARDRSAFLIEMNPRPIGTTHLGQVFGHDIVAALLARMRREPVQQVTPSSWVQRPVALFPKELERDPVEPYRLSSGAVLHDVPDDDPAVVEAYLRRLSRIHPQAMGDIACALRRHPCSTAPSRPTCVRQPVTTAYD